MRCLARTQDSGARTAGSFGWTAIAGERTLFWCPECNQMLEAQPPGEEHSYMCAVEGCGGNNGTGEGEGVNLGMTVEMARKVLAEQARRANIKKPPYIDELHPSQMAFWEDPNRFKVAICGRRAGKTSLAYRGLLQGMGANPNTIQAYIGVTRESAKRLAWNPLRRLAKQYGLPIQFNKVELIAYHANGAELWILGADKEEDMDKMRGAAYKRVVIDEAASYRAFIERMVNEVIEPALGDHRGDLWLMGTPGRTAAGFFYDASINAPGFEKFSVHKWTVADNPYFLDPEDWLKSFESATGGAKTTQRTVESTSESGAKTTMRLFTSLRLKETSFTTFLTQ